MENPTEIETGVVYKGWTQRENKLMVFDDDIPFRNRLKRELETRGFHVCAAGSIKRGSRMLRIVRPSYAILDLKLADGNGLSLVRELRRQNSKCRIVMLTGFGNIATAVAAVKAGAVDYLQKPACAEAIVDALQNNGKDIPPVRDYPMSADRVRWEHIHRVYAQCGCNISETARRLRMHRRTLQRLLKSNPPNP